MDFLSNLITAILDWYAANMGYGTITLLMAIESTFVPLPSELVLPPVAWQATLGLVPGHLNLFLIILVSSLGCVLGALVNYSLSYFLGRKIIYGLVETKVAKIFFLNREKLEKAEAYFCENGNTSTFIGRLVPVIRHLISIPAGLAKMNLKKFVIYTFLGSLLWNTVLSFLGYFLGQNQELIMQYIHELSYVAIAAGVLFVIYVIWKKKRAKAAKENVERVFGIIGFPLTASFSRNFFNQKFEKEGISARYDLCPLENIEDFSALITQQSFAGMNVTIPHKQAVMKYLDELDETAKEIGAVNVLQFRKENGEQKIKGFNSDAIGFENSLLPLLKPHHTKALVLGTGGASKAVTYVLRKNNIPYTLVSRTKIDGQYTYDELNPEIIAGNTLIINTTPLGMYPVDSCPDIPYDALTTNHLLYDLVYNPEKTVFLERGEEQGAAIKNGMEMLHGQAIAAWEIWNQK
jgi:shikimate dehydrogenase